MVRNEQHLGVRHRRACCERLFRLGRSIAENERFKIPLRRLDDETVFVCAVRFRQQRRPYADLRRSERERQLFGHIFHPRPLPLRRSENLREQGRALRFKRQIERTDAHTLQELRRAVGVVGVEVSENERIDALPAFSPEKLHGAFPGVVRDPASAAIDHRGVSAAREDDAFALPDVERRKAKRIAPAKARNAGGGKEQRERKPHRRKRTEAPRFPGAQPRGEEDHIYEHEPAEEKRISHIYIRARQPREETGHRINVPHAPREDAGGGHRGAGEKRAERHKHVPADVDRRNGPEAEDV